MEKEFKDINEATKENDTYDVEGVEIFKVGKWNGDNYTEKDLEEMEMSFGEIGSTIKPYLKLGHNNKQELLKTDGMPAAGWVTNVRRKGGSLIADFKSVPKKIYELIQKKAYGRMSSEIYWNLKANDKTYKRVLKAVALLGADTPAVQTLDDFINLYTENVEYEIIKDYHKITEETSMEELKIYQDKIADLESKLAKFTEIEKSYSDLQAQVKEYTDKIDILEAEKEKIFADKKEEEVKNYLESAVTDGKILPAQVAFYTELAMGEKTYSMDGKETSALDMVKSIVDSNEKQVDFSEDSNHEEIDKTMTDEDKFFDKAKKYAEENGVEFKDACIAIEMEEK